MASCTAASRSRPDLRSAFREHSCSQQHRCQKRKDAKILMGSHLYSGSSSWIYTGICIASERLHIIYKLSAPAQS